MKEPPRMKDEMSISSGVTAFGVGGPFCGSPSASITGVAGAVRWGSLRFRGCGHVPDASSGAAMSSWADLSAGRRTHSTYALRRHSYVGRVWQSPLVWSASPYCYRTFTSRRGLELLIRVTQAGVRLAHWTWASLLQAFGLMNGSTSQSKCPRK